MRQLPECLAALLPQLPPDAEAILVDNGSTDGTPAWVQALNMLWALGIVYSTLATRQHVLLDVLGGTLLAAVVCRAGSPRGELVPAGA